MYNNIKIRSIFISYPLFLQTFSYLIHEKYNRKNKKTFNSFFYWCGNA